jgi:hypothetical protein
MPVAFEETARSPGRQDTAEQHGCEKPALENVVIVTATVHSAFYGHRISVSEPVPHKTMLLIERYLREAFRRQLNISTRNVTVLCEGSHYVVASNPLPCGDPEVEDPDFETAYQQIGWWKGPQPPRDVRRQSHEFWAKAGEGGVRWLVKRLRRERNIEVLHGAASLLASLEIPVIDPILDELETPSVGDNGLALLGALGKLRPNPDAIVQVRLANTLRKYLRHSLLELREAAAAATAILPAERAVGLLREALQREANPVVRETLQDAIADRQEEKD